MLRVTIFLFFSAFIGISSALKRDHDYSCIKRGQDYGGEAPDVDASCTYATVIAIMTNNANYTVEDWMPEVTMDGTIKTLLDCQKHCAANAECFAFAYEWENGFHECFLKKEIDRPDICPEYQTWQAPEDDPNWFGASGPPSCVVPPRCFKHDFDYGGMVTDTCDYAKVLKVVANSADYEFPGWAETTEVNEDLKSYFDCQMMCLNMDGCDYFSYEYELEWNGQNRYHECFLKAEQVPTAAGRQLSQENFGLGKNCPQYTIWAFEDPMWRGTSGPKQCQLPSECIKADFDYGRQSSDTCDYAKVLKVIANHANFTMPDWHTDATAVDETLAGVHDCQVLCQQLDTCDFFSYQYETQESDGVDYHECYLKEAYADDSCTPYLVWPFLNPTWRGASGPKNCPVPTTCVKQEFDYGRETSDTCPYADVVKIVANSARWIVPEWFSGPKAVDESLYSAFDCQALCKADADCKFFSFQFEFGFRQCYMKSPVEDPENCPEYVIWPFDDYNWQGASGPEDCPMPSTCLKPEFDYGGASSDDCGYADVLQIVANSQAFDIPTWAKDVNVDTVVDTTLNTPEDCQALCAKNPDCKGFAYEYEAVSKSAEPQTEFRGHGSFHECYLKGGIQEGCPAYVIWAFDDPAWKGVSGPPSCDSGSGTTTAAGTTTASDTGDGGDGGEEAVSYASTTSLPLTAMLCASMMVAAIVV